MDLRPTPHPSSAMSIAACVLQGVIACTTLPPPAASNETPEARLPVGSKLYHFRTSDGLRLTVLDLEDPTRALVRVDGIASREAGVVMPAERRETSRYLGYRIQLDGRTALPLTRTYRGEWLTPMYNSAPLSYVESPNDRASAEQFYAAHVEQTRNGLIARLQRYDRAAAEARASSGLTMSAEDLTEKCGRSPTVSIDWTNVPDSLLMKEEDSCAAVSKALEQTCHVSTIRELISRIDTITCRLGATGKVTLANRELVWPRTSEGSESSTQRLLAVTLADGRTVAEHIIEAETAVCVDETRTHFAVIPTFPGGLDLTSPTGKLAYGDGQHFTRVDTASRGWSDNDRWNVTYFDPRQPDHEGKVHLDLRERKCAFTCGDVTTDGSLLDEAATRDLLKRATYHEPADSRQPYALARDRQGRYYYVDRGSDLEQQRDFHVYRGMRGKLRRLPLEDVVSDSKGEIFATADGRLRLLMNREEAQWLEGDKVSVLDVLRIHESIELIYNELGVYFGLRLHVPCDDF